MAIGGSFVSVLRDGTDATYVEQQNNNVSAGFRVGYDDYAIPSNAQIRSVQMAIRAAGVIWNPQALQGKLGTIGTIVEQSDDFVLDFGVQAENGTPRPDPNSGRLWLQDEINVVTTAFFSSPNSPANSGGCRIMQASLLVVVNLAPIATPLTPAGTVTTTSHPVVQWTYLDAEGDAQERYRIRLFNSAQYLAGGFDPGASDAVWDSEEAFTASTSRAINPIVLGDTNAPVSYRAYVSVADAGSNGRHSYWGPFASWSQAVPSPSPPTLVATADTPNSRVVLTLVAGGGVSTTSIVVQRSDDSGTTYRDVVRCAPGTCYDYSAPRNGAALWYRARGIHDDGTTYSESAYSAPALVTLPSDGSAWLKSLTNPALNTRLCLATHEFSSKSDEPQGVFLALGRPDPVINGGIIGKEIFDSIPFAFLNDDQYKAFEVLRATKGPLLLQTCYGDSRQEQYMIRLISPRNRTLVTVPEQSKAQLRTVQIPAMEVAYPGV